MITIENLVEKVSKGECFVYQAAMQHWDCVKYPYVKNAKIMSINQYLIDTMRKGEIILQYDQDGYSFHLIYLCGYFWIERYIDGVLDSVDYVKDESELRIALTARS